MTNLETVFSVDDRGNIVDFYERLEDGTIEQVAQLDREAGKTANELVWDNWSGPELEAWAVKNGYEDEILEAGVWLQGGCI